MKSLLWAAFSAGLLHALAPDHWMPFTMIGRSKNWSLRRLNGTILAGGVAHLASSFLISVIGIFLGRSALQTAHFETLRGGFAWYFYMAAGITYLVWAVKQMNSARVHSSHPSKDAAFWTVFAFLVLGPCEPMIPFLFMSSAVGSWTGILLTALVFSVGTLTSMMLVSNLVFCGILSRWMDAAGRFSHLIAAGTILSAGVFVRLLGI